MRIWIYATACLLACATGGCSCSQRDTGGGDGDAGPVDGALADGRRDGPGGDSRPQRDGSLDWDAGTCGDPWYWELRPIPVYSATLANGAPPRVGVTEQLLVEVQLLSGSCQALGGVEVAIMPGDATDFVELRAYAWTVAGPVPCTPDAPIVSTVVLIPGRGMGNTRVVVSDGNTPDGQYLLTYQRTYCSGMPDCQCYPGSPAGSGQEYATCLTDCSCAAGLSCIGAIGLVGAGWNCRRPCADDRDCNDYEFCAKYVADAAAYVCEPGNQCLKPDDCPEGFACVARADGLRTCADQRAAPTMQDCTCDAQCPPGQRCSVALGATPRCAVWCESDAACPAAGAGWLVCGTPAVCLPLE